MRKQDLKSLQDLVAALENTNYKAILFDMDGTLLNTEELHVNAVAKILSDQNIDTTNYVTKDLIDEFTGKSDREVHEYFVENTDFKSSLNDFLAIKNSMLCEEIKTTLKNTIILEGYEELLLKLKEKYLLGLVTASEDSVAHGFLNTLDLAKYFDTIITVADTKRTKPEPDPYLLAMQRLKLNPEETLILEDSNTGIQAAEKSKSHHHRVFWY